MTRPGPRSSPRSGRPGETVAAGPAAFAVTAPRGAIFFASRLFADAEQVFAPGAVAVAGGTVVGAGTPGQVEREAGAGFRKVDLAGAAILPGLVNAHTHFEIPQLSGGGAPRQALPATQTVPGTRAAPAGAAPPKAPETAAFALTPSSAASEPASPPSPFVEWLLAVIAWKRTAPRAEFGRNLDEAVREALACGTTCAGEIAGPDAGAYRTLPLRARIFAEAIGFLPQDEEPAAAAVERTFARLAALESSLATMRAGLAPHTLYTAGAGLLRRVAALAARTGSCVSLHVAESRAEMEFLRSGTGDIARRLYPAVGKDVSWFCGLGAPIPRFLAAAGLLREGLVLVHNVFLRAEEVAELRAGGARFILCPRSNEAHGNGAPNVTGFVDGGVPFALGTDSLGSVPTLSLWDEIRAARALYRGKLGEGDLCRVLFRAATENGADALGLPCGALRPNAPADFIAVDDPGGRGIGAFRNLVEKTDKGSVRLAAVAGRILLDRT